MAANHFGAKAQLTRAPLLYNPLTSQFFEGGLPNKCPQTLLNLPHHPIRFESKRVMVGCKETKIEPKIGIGQVVSPLTRRVTA